MSSLTSSQPEDALRRRLARRHHLAGWMGLLFFLSMGAFLEGLHGFKVGSYLDLDRKLRRELWTLAHAHGALLALVNVAFAAGLVQFGNWRPTRLKLASFFLLDAAFLIPLGFFLGGVNPSETDPGLAILFVPLGFVLLFVSAAHVVWSAL